MAISLYRFRIELSDVDRSVYGDLDFRIARHPSETEDYLLTRVVAFALNKTDSDDVEITPGLCADDQPALGIRDGNGAYKLWIEIGNPSARRLHKASKASRSVKIYTYKDPGNLKREIAGGKIHRLKEIELFALTPSFLKELQAHLKRDNDWGLIRNDGELTISVGDDRLVIGALSQFRLED